ncbi:MAG: hypothetical protein HYZ45_03760, partial [Burkholderiales bacterium]|nr:hypothetical protein [Burkholderiales bacterium]
TFGMLLSRATINEEGAKRWRDMVNAFRKDGTLKRLYERLYTSEEAEQFQRY